jgi:hypothetical protein
MKNAATVPDAGQTFFRPRALRANLFSRVSPFLAIPLLLVLLAGGCAKTQMQKIMPYMSNMQLLHAYFGDPTGSVELPNGTIRHEWVLDRLYRYPGGIEMVRVYVGHDRDGYRQYVDREVYVPPRSEYQYCKMTAIADRSGNILHSAWEGSHCDELPVLRAGD